MRSVNIKKNIWSILVVSGILFLLLAHIKKISLLNAWEYSKLIPEIALGDFIIFTIFANWLWKWPIFRNWLVPYPNLNGTWVGEIRSDWVNNETGKRIPPIPAMITIQQTFFNISCVMRTGEMRSDSYVEGFQIDKERQIKQLAYSYQSRPNLTLQERSTPHDGTTVLEIIESPELKLKGRYWTERKTTGELIFQFQTSETLEELPPDIQDHPMAGQTANG